MFENLLTRLESLEPDLLDVLRFTPEAKALLAALSSPDTLRRETVEALKPFAEKNIHRDAADRPDDEGEAFHFKYGDLRRARAAYRKLTEKPK